MEGALFQRNANGMEECRMSGCLASHTRTFPELVPPRGMEPFVGQL